MTRRLKSKLLLCAALVALFAFSKGGAAAAGVDNDDYRLREGDLLMVTVWREESLQKEVRVLPDGSITYPLVGRLDVAGLTVAEVKERVGERLARYISDPEVTVLVTGIEGNQVHVLGRVNKPGPIVMAGPTTALQAISLAGGLDPFASGNAIQVLRQTADGDELLPVRYNDLIRGRSLDTNVRLQPGDTLLVP
ncbi:hypothetical protein CAI21_09795 [Alkalilimnicola ehrlichii]|uniref:Uncharacterized protein n=1 Tax=Alkalilimnicola ehrlichii TaxID=351052 RepID=A0A3E0WY88_9GAMM|nr:polysaccharide biosynthesis/export family protein [Alkalilimnicola ehrlichii]RFA29353.1 hypothetical protein CAI21_09795 [Alkalilimnicola ehrlichii]RFA36867.1 hypothetical protein CAL65_10130 [Alkalilimnicola ehrlichii]